MEHSSLGISEKHLALQKEVFLQARLEGFFSSGPSRKDAGNSGRDWPAASGHTWCPAGTGDLGEGWEG